VVGEGLGKGPDDLKKGFVTPSFKEGSIFVENAEGKIMRLAWEAMDGENAGPLKEKRARLRALLPGEYTVTGYRLLRKDDRGTKWTLSGLNAGGVSTFKVETGKKSVIRIDPTVHFGSKGVLNRKREFMVQASIQGQHHAGVTIYKASKRIAMNYKVTGANGVVLESGKMNYG